MPTSTRWTLPILPAADQLAGQAEPVVRAAAGSRSARCACCSRRLDHLAAFGDRQRQRLLAVHVLARLAGVDRHQRVPVVGRGDDDGVDVLAVEQLAVVADTPSHFPPACSTLFTAAASRLESTSHTAAALLMNFLRLLMPCPPTPMCPVTIRSLAPNARLGTSYGQRDRAGGRGAGGQKLSTGVHL